LFHRGFYRVEPVEACEAADSLAVVG
jgi:hypothetical protein